MEKGKVASGRSRERMKLTFGVRGHVRSLKAVTCRRIPNGQE